MLGVLQVAFSRDYRCCAGANSTLRNFTSLSISLRRQGGGLLESEG
jgi:hypothetical protein